MHQVDEKYMRRAIELAYLGKGSVSPNPMVGCVIVKDDIIIGEGWHMKYGQPHAEVNAVNAVQNKEDLKEATAYVTLEPCSHFGKTPPCADLLIKMNLQKVVVGCVDPNPLVAGKGIKKLRAAGIAVVEGILEQECLKVNEVFFHSIKEKRPFIVLKWAQTADGFVARNNFDSKWISNGMSRQLVHKWRGELDAILVGKNTAKYDDPSLTTREWKGKNPVRVLIDHELEIREDSKLLNQETKTFVYNLKKDEQLNNLRYVKLKADSFLNDLLTDLNQEGVRSVLIEGGSRTIQQFIDQGLWDEARVFVASSKFEQGIEAPNLSSAIHIESSVIKEDILNIYKYK